LRRGLTQRLHVLYLAMPEEPMRAPSSDT
jgi:hypothetical protein